MNNETNQLLDLAPLGPKRPRRAPTGGPAGSPASRFGHDGRVLTCAGQDNAIRWREGERLEHLFEQRCDELGDALAVDGPGARLSYAQLDARANQLARLLGSLGAVAPGDRVGLLFDTAVDGYVGMLAVLKLHAAYVPLDAGFPADRLSFIASDCGARLILSRSNLAESFTTLDAQVEVLYLDELEAEIAAAPEGRLGALEREDTTNDLCYVIYTSGTTGRPKGVAVGHPSVCNFVRVAAEVYGVQSDDRVYQGLTIAFDFVLEEIWVAWMVGATLVPRGGVANLLGLDLHEFLEEQRVTALCCVPTLLATLEQDLPDLRFLLVSGEPCPQDLVDRWSRSGRRFMNVYGPTEATVSATWTLLDSGRPVTIGVPLPTYSIVILDPEEDRALPLGQQGEIGIAGVGLADGYLNDPDRTDRAFIPDFLCLPGNPSGRIYRSGDLGRINGEGEIEHCGRIDTQVKIRGYRIELAEIEAVLRQVPGVGQAVVSTYRPAPGVEELVGYYSPGSGSRQVESERAYALLREKLPSYMVPTYLEPLEELPLMASGKIDRDKLAEPTTPRRMAGLGEHVAPASDLESALAGELAGILGVERVSVDGHFFNDLGASSLLMARFNAALRKRGDLPVVSMRDVYLQPTVRRLAEAVCERGTDRPATAAPDFGEPSLPEPTGTPHYVLCGVLQLLAFLVYACLAALAFDVASQWLTAAKGPLDVYARAVVVGGAALMGAGLLPIVAKWVLIGRWKPQRIRVWSVTYVRFWIVKTLVIANPLARLVAGTPLFALYLRALGAKVGKGAVILTRHVPVCTDLLSIGADSLVLKDAYLNGYRARSGVIEIGAIALGGNAFVGEHSVLDIETTLKDGAQLGHASALHAGQVVPAGACWHGSPAEPADEDYNYRRVPSASCGSRRRAIYSGLGLLSIFGIVGPLAAATQSLLLTHPRLLDQQSEVYAPIIAASLVLGLPLVGLLVGCTAPRLLTRALEPGRIYPLYGLRYTLQRLVARTSNIPSLTSLFGDSSAIVGYLQSLGYRLGAVEQTGSNFGTTVKHEVPGLCHVGSGTMVSDGLSMANAEFSSSSFRVMPVVIGKRNYLGNGVVYPPGARTGDNCLLATKAMIPIGGPVRRNVGLLGSPSFEIPRSVDVDDELRRLATGSERERRLPAKTRHNVVTMALHLLVQILFISAVLLIALAPFNGGTGWAAMASTAGSIVLDVVVIPVALFVLVERSVTGFRPLQPKVCSIYEIDFWRHERFWKVPSLAYLRLFDGTPFKGLVWRLLGVRVGRRVFDDGCALVERTLVTLGSEVTLNMGSVLQCHSMEDAVFKSDRVTIGSNCTVGTGAFVHYGVVMEDDSLLEADAFLMKGSRISAGDRWRGNPATQA